MKLEVAIQGVLDAEQELQACGDNPHDISKFMYQLGQYASAAEKILGEYEQDYEREWADDYKSHLTGGGKVTATSAKQYADVENADTKGQIKYLSRFVASAWRQHTNAMTRVKHLREEMKGGV